MFYSDYQIMMVLWFGFTVVVTLFSIVFKYCRQFLLEQGIELLAIKETRNLILQLKSGHSRSGPILVSRRMTSTLLLNIKETVEVKILRRLWNCTHTWLTHAVYIGHCVNKLYEATYHGLTITIQ